MNLPNIHNNQKSYEQQKDELIQKQSDMQNSQEMKKYSYYILGESLDEKNLMYFNKLNQKINYDLKHYPYLNFELNKSRYHLSHYLSFYKFNQDSQDLQVYPKYNKLTKETDVVNNQSWTDSIYGILYNNKITETVNNRVVMSKEYVGYYSRSLEYQYFKLKMQEEIQQNI